MVVGCCGVLVFGIVVLWFYGLEVLWFCGVTVFWFYGVAALWYYCEVVWWDSSLNFEQSRSIFCVFKKIRLDLQRLANSEPANSEHPRMVLQP